MSTSSPDPSSDLWLQRWQRFAAAAVRAFHAYGTWLASISWKRFALLAVLLMIVVSLLQKLPPFTWTITESVVAPQASRTPVPPLPPLPPLPQGAVPDVHIEVPASPGAAASAGARGFELSIDEHGVRLLSKGASGAPASAASAPAEVASIPDGARVVIQAGDQKVAVKLPPGARADEVRDAIEEAKQEVVDAMQEARDAAQEARDAAQEAADESTAVRTRKIHFGDFLTDLAALWIVASAIIKITYKGRMQAEVKAAQATETAEAESLKRQVVEARMAAMQAQVEPHFLFNTLASIDHLIETDPPRASQMQKNLIALLRASMPSMRETADAASRDLGRELAVVRPYIEILKVRMEERLDARIDVPDGLLSAEFPAMMIQTLVENAIRHGLEPKPEGGQLRVKAEIVHGKLQVSVADTGVGFGAAATAGTGVGLANIRERLQLLHGPQASLTVTANQPCGTVVTITVPYRTVAGAGDTTA
ncbi:histidine kinase [Ideonella sp. B7]|uniref:sensor histidine kinase n=1 Tax=Ideonella benzenivorans TaxID=2831643 RepID=UPI001CED0190|nr:histidine kinase [Ideonella benzenivorans]MCA6215229.1 histidine kinase [Ideonella benzenivorans]